VLAVLTSAGVRLVNELLHWSAWWPNDESAFYEPGQRSGVWQKVRVNQVQQCGRRISGNIAVCAHWRGLPAGQRNPAASDGASSFMFAFSSEFLDRCARRVGKSSRTRMVIPSLRATARDSLRTRRRMTSTGLSARPKFSLRISLPARITAPRSSAWER
jgi:hypothetical protein